MTKAREIEIFSAGCSVCRNVISMAEKIACPSCAITVADMNDPAVAARAAELGIASVPAIVIDGVLSPCCSGGPDEQALRAAGIGTPL